MNIEEILHANLTDEQYSAVIDDSRNILCLACAGSGKSRTLAYKIAYLISRGEAPESIIAFTFTEKAAESIKRRVAEALHKFGLSENIVGAMFIGTLDAFCQKLLGDINAKYRQFDILDQNRLVLYVMSRFRKLGLQNGQGYFKRIKDFTDAWQTMHNENIALKDIEQYDEELFCRLSCLSELLSNDGYMDFSFAIYLTVFKDLISRYSPVTIMKWLFLYGTIACFPVLYKDVVSVDYASLVPDAWWRIGYVVLFATFLSYLLVPIGQKNLRPTTLSMYNYVQPLVASFVAVLIGLDTFGLVKGIAG